jgi:hypothetical protein
MLLTIIGPDLSNLLHSMFTMLGCHAIKHFQKLYFWIELKGDPMILRIIYNRDHCSEFFNGSFHINSFIL